MNRDNERGKRIDRWYQKSLLYRISLLDRATVTYIESDLFWHSLCLVGESPSVALPPTLRTRLLTKLKLLQQNKNRILGKPHPPPPYTSRRFYTQTTNNFSCSRSSPPPLLQNCGEKLHVPSMYMYIYLRQPLVHFRSGFLHGRLLDEGTSQLCSQH